MARDVYGLAGKPIPLGISVEGANPQRGSLFIFKGLPPGAILKPGGNFGDFWAVNSNVFDRLTLTVPHGTHGDFTIHIVKSSAASEGHNLHAAFSARIMNPEPDNRTETTATFVQIPTIKSIQPETKSLNKPVARNLQNGILMERATSLLSLGDVSGARTILKYLTTRGNAQAAIALGGTYDPAILKQLFIKGLDPDPEKAREWYQKAAKLGSPEAKSRLIAIASE